MAAGPVTIEWADSAIQDLHRVHEYIEERNVPASYETVNRITRAVQSLETFPQIGRRGRVAGTRELVIEQTPYLVAYKVRPASVWILAVLHGAQLWPKTFEGK